MEIENSIVNLESKESEEGIDSIRSIINDKIRDEEEGKEGEISQIQSGYNSGGLRDSADLRFIDVSLNNPTLIDRKRSSIGRKIDDKGICGKSGCWIF